MGANERQVGGSHYKQTGAVEHWDIVAQWDLDYFQGQITKYVLRWRAKGGIQDLEKAKHFLEKYIEVETLKALDKALGGEGKVSAVAVGELRRTTRAGEEIPRQKVRPSRKR